MKKDEIQEVFTVTPLPDDPPEGEIKVVANIGGEEAVGPKPQIVSNKEFGALIIVQIDNADSYPHEKNKFFEQLAEQIYKALKGFSYAGFRVISANVHTDADMSDVRPR